MLQKLNFNIKYIDTVPCIIHSANDHSSMCQISIPGNTI